MLSLVWSYLVAFGGLTQLSLEINKNIVLQTQDHLKKDLQSYKKK